MLEKIQEKNKRACTFIREVRVRRKFWRKWENLVKSIIVPPQLSDLAVKILPTATGLVMMQSHLNQFTSVLPIFLVHEQME